MVIHKKENFQILSWLVLIILVLTGSVLSAGELGAREAMQETYGLSDSISKEDANRLVRILKKESAKLRNTHLLARINYRIGMVYYKASMLDESCETFVKTASDNEFLPVVCAACHNMAAMVLKQQGRYEDAIRQFEKNVSLTIADYRLNSKSNPVILKLGCLALFNIADIYQSQGDVDRAIDAYGRLLGILPYSREERFRKYVPIAKDRLSQLYLYKKQPAKYFSVCQGLLVDYPRYYRWDLINFEIKCIKCIQQIAGFDQLPQTSYAAPAMLTKLFKDVPERDKIAGYAAEFESDISREPRNYGQLLKNYYCSWLFDSAGKKQLAFNSIQAINGKISNKTGYDNLDAIFTAIEQYGKVFQAVILMETSHYKEAKEVLGSIEPEENQPHMSKLISSINDSIDILKREVRENAEK